MSMALCKICEKIIDTDFELKSDENGDCICAVCAEGTGDG